MTNVHLSAAAGESCEGGRAAGVFGWLDPGGRKGEGQRTLSSTAGAGRKAWGARVCRVRFSVEGVEADGSIVR